MVIRIEDCGHSHWIQERSANSMLKQYTGTATISGLAGPGGRYLLRESIKEGKWRITNIGATQHLLLREYISSGRCVFKVLVLTRHGIRRAW